MSEDQKRILEQQLWNIANTLRGKMNADEFRDYILGFIFYKYLSEKMELFANEILTQDKIKFRDINAKTKDSKEFLEAIKEEALQKLGYFLKPEELFSGAFFLDKKIGFSFSSGFEWRNDGSFFFFGFLSPPTTLLYEI